MNWRSLLSMAAVFFFGNALSKLVVFIAFPIYTYFLPPASIGRYDVNIALGTIVAGLVFMDVWVGVMKRLMDSEVGGDITPGSVVKAGLVIALGALCALAVVTTVANLGFGMGDAWWVYSCVGTAGMRELWAFTTRGLGRTTAYAFSGLVAAVVTMGVTLVLLVTFRFDVTALYIGVTAGNLAQIIFLEPFARVVPMLLRSSFDFQQLKSLFWFSVPLGINSVSYWLFTGMGRIAVSAELSLAVNGLYATASKFGAILSLLSGVITLVWQQISFTHGLGETRFFQRGMLLATGVYLGGAAVIAPIGQWLYGLLVAPEYLPGAATVPGFVMVAAIAGYSTFVGNIFYAIEKTAAIFYSSVAVLAVVALATFPLVRIFGIDGANYALLAGYIVGLFVRYVILRKVADVRHPWKAELIAVIGLASLWAMTAEGLVLASLVLVVGCVLFAVVFVRNATKAS